MSGLDVAEVREDFPALRRRVHGEPAAYLDGPGGTQVPQQVIEAMGSVLERGVSNQGGGFASSDEADEAVAEARSAMADLLGADPSEIVFGQNMTSLTFSVSRALAATWGAGDNIVVTSLDHDANITPWVLAAGERGVEVRRADFDVATGRLAVDAVAAAVDGATRLVAVTAASNALGTLVDVPAIAAAAHRAGALVFVDGVHRTPHTPVDVSGWDVDFYAASAYKFFGPHTGVLFGKAEHLEAFDAYKVRPAPDAGPGKWETGTQSFESLAGVTAAVDYLASLGDGADRRSRLASAMAAVAVQGEAQAERFLAGAAEISGLHVHGITDEVADRTPTFAVALDGHHPQEAARALGEQGIFVWAGHYYAVAVMERLGVLDGGGLLRIGFVHYNSMEEVDRALDALDRLG